ncbi:MAG TPA: hypothetical protein VG891_13160 [Rhizomicrobium sp.]|nr:hypothetical protein [Rhizomicrobium sp.]
MASDAYNPKIVGPSLVARQKTPDSNVGAGLAGSAALHGLVALLFLFLISHRTPVPQQVFRIVPIDMVQLGDETASPAERQKAVVPQAKAAPKPKYNPAPQGVAPGKTKPVPDELESKLRALSKLRVPPIETQLEKDETAASNVAAESDGARGRHAMYSLRDYIRAQVERKWSLNLERLTSHDVAIPIRIEITDRGIVTKAEIVEVTRAAHDRVYRDIAISARNAVLLSSPISLPDGQYKSVMEITLLLNPKDTLR